MKKYWISTTIKKVWMDKILSGEKTMEYKGKTKYWKTRINKILGAIYDDYKNKQEYSIFINFLCGQKSYKYNVVSISIQQDKPRWENYERREYGFDIDGKKYYDWYEIHLGERIL